MELFCSKLSFLTFEEKKTRCHNSTGGKTNLSKLVYRIMQKLKTPINIILTIEIQMKNLGTSLRRGLLNINNLL